ncbi:MAG: polysaccharide lyase family protein [Armatimonadota bacterium]
MQRACLATLLALLTATACHAQPLWEIGSFDNDFAEFASAAEGYGNYTQAFPNDADFTVGEDEPARAFPFILPGPADAWAGRKGHTLTIRFTAPEPPPAAELLLDLVTAQAPLGQRLEVKLNGHGGEFYLEPGGPDDALTDAAKGAERTLKILLRGEHFSRGPNVLVLRSTHGSWALFDALRLSPLPAIPKEAVISRFALRPTDLFVRRGGHLFRAVYADITNAGGSVTANVELSLDGGRTWERAAAAVPIGFGTLSQRLLVSDARVGEGLTVKARLRAGETTLEAEAEIRPAKKWTIYIAPSVHTDIGYTDVQPKVYEQQAKILDDAMRFVDETRDYGEGSRFKWNIEVAWQLDNYLEMRGEESFNRLVEHAKRGDIGIGGLYLNMLSALCGGEELCRLTYKAGEMRRKYGIEINTAHTTDVPSYTWFYASLLPKSGIKYLAAGLNNTRGPFHSLTDLQTPVWWEGPDGERTLLWFARGYAQAKSFAQPPERMADHIRSYLGRFPEDRYPYEVCLAYGGFSDNQSINRAFCDAIKDWNDQWEYPKLVVCRTGEFFEELEGRYADQIPVVRGDWGAFWEDGAASTARKTARSRSLHAVLPIVEKAGTLRSLVGEPYPREELNSAWRNLILYDEHTWGAHNSVSQPESDFAKEQWRHKAAFVEAAAKTVSGLYPIWLPRPAVTAKPRGEPYPLRIDGKRSKNAARAAGRQVENEFYRIALDPQTGAISSLYDKELKRELVDESSPYGLNHLIYCAGQPPGEVKRLTPTTAEIKTEAHRENAASVQATVAAGTVTQATQHVWLFPGSRVIRIYNVLEKELTYDKEAVYYAFPFAVPGGTIRANIGNAIMRPELDQISGACKDWYSVDGYVDISNDEFGVTWLSEQAPLVEFCDINTDKWLKELPLTNQTIFSYIMNNYWFTNYAAGQQGELVFLYAIQVHPGPYDPAAGASLKERGSPPFKPSLSTWTPKPPLPQPQLQGDDLRLIALKRPEDPERQNSVIARVWNCAPEKATSRLAIRGTTLKAAYECQITEERLRKLRVDDKRGVFLFAKPNEVLTIELVPAPVR